MTYDELLARQPIDPWTPSAAAGYVQIISAFLETRDTSGMERAERNYLYRLRQKWQRRADGLEMPRSKPAPVTVEKPSEHVAAVPETAVDDLDPLSASLIRKYGRSE